MTTSTDLSTAEPLRISVETDSPKADQDWVYRSLSAHTAKTTGGTDHVPLTIFLRDAQGQLYGGLLGWTLWSWMHIDSLWVEESHRGQGYGAQLLAAAESTARLRGCEVIEVQTFNFMTLGFYEHAGYQVFGTLKGIGRGKYERYYLTKSLV